MIFMNLKKGHGLFKYHPFLEANSNSLDDLLDSLSASQQNVFNAFKDKHPFSLIQSPPGTGKTHFIKTLVGMMVKLGYHFIAAAPSNSATDHLASKIEEAYPEMGTIRFHAWDNEAAALARQGKREFNPATDETHDEGETLRQSETETVQIVPDDPNANLEWNGTKVQRPNWRSMSLHHRVLQNTGMIPNEIPVFEKTSDDIHKDFRELLQAPDKTDDDKTRFTAAQELAMTDTMTKAPGLVTTLSKTADSKLCRTKKPVIAIVDECVQAAELEIFLYGLITVEVSSTFFSLEIPSNSRLRSRRGWQTQSRS
ncbi:hypothetical protein ACLMJK_000783 [Lecanora helva]